MVPSDHGLDPGSSTDGTEPAAVILLCDESDEQWLRRTLADPGFYVTEAAVLALGAVTGLLGAAAPWFVQLLVHGAGRHRVAGRAVVRCGRGVQRFPRRQVSRCMPGARVAATPRPPWLRGSV